MRRREFLQATAAALAPPPPNILYILADDLGIGDLGCYNPESRIPTPNLDRLAASGMRFSDMHSPSSVCTPTRYGILTGRYCWRSKLRNGVLNGYSPALLEDGRPTVASFLKQQGYHTFGVGKWHLGLGNSARTEYSLPLRPGPLDAGFDRYFGIPASLDMPPYLYFENDRAVVPPTARIPDGGGPDPSGPFWRGGAAAPNWKMEQVLPDLTRKSVEWLRAAARARRPFFHYFAMTGPHTPWVPTRDFEGRSRAGAYGDFVAQVDDTVGQLLRTLEDSGAARNTLVLFASDNGSRWTQPMIDRWQHRSNANWRGMKADIYDAGHRIPFLARWPGRIAPGSVCPELGCLTDLFATAAAASRTPLPEAAAEDSFNLLPLLSNETRQGPREAVVHHSGNGVFAIRDRRWKLDLGRGSGGFTQPVKIEPGPGEPPGELYDMQSDPAEQRNLYQEKPEEVARLTALLERWKSAGRSR